MPPAKESVHGLRGAFGSAPGACRRGELEEAEQRLELPRRSVRRQGLVGRVGEQDQAVRAVRAHESVEGGRDPCVRVGGDAGRHVEHDNAARRSGQQRGRRRRLPKCDEQEDDRGHNGESCAGKAEPPDRPGAALEGRTRRQARSRSTSRSSPLTRPLDPIGERLGIRGARLGPRPGDGRRVVGKIRLADDARCEARGTPTIRRVAHRRLAEQPHGPLARVILEGAAGGGSRPAERSRQHERANGNEGQAEQRQERCRRSGRESERRPRELRRAAEARLGRLDGCDADAGANVHLDAWGGGDRAGKGDLSREEARSRRHACRPRTAPTGRRSSLSR